MRGSLLLILKQIHIKQIHITVLACLFLVPFCVASSSNHGLNHDDWNYQETHTDVRDFASGGTLHLHMSVGDVVIKRGEDNKIRLQYTVKSRREKNLKESHVGFDVRGTDATLEFQSSYESNTQFDVEIEVPANTALDVHEKVGDLTLEKIEGDKDLSLGVGDIHIQQDASTYRLVRASTGIGDVNSEYGESSGWLGKTLKYHGDGKYELRAHVGVGDINIEGK
jgi:hypothetical protein